MYSLCLVGLLVFTTDYVCFAALVKQITAIFVAHLRNCFLTMSLVLHELLVCCRGLDNDKATERKVCVTFLSDLIDVIKHVNHC